MKSTEMCMFLAPSFFGGKLREFLELGLIYKIDAGSDHVAKFVPITDNSVLYFNQSISQSVYLFYLLTSLYISDHL